jgi:hypothetical protein
VKAHLVRAEKEIKRRDHRIFKELEEHEHAAVLPERLRVLVKNSLKSGQAEEVRMLREKLAALEASADRLRTANLLGDGAAHIGGAAASAPGTPSAKQGGGRFDEEAPASPVRRQLSASRGAGSARNLAEGAGSSKGAEALMAARAEVDRLQKLCAAHDVIREGLEKRVAQLEAQLSRHAGAAPPDSGAAGPAAAGAAAKPGGFGEGEHDSKEGGASLFTEEGRGFDNYIRRLAGLSELPSPAAGGDPGSLRVSTDVKSKRRPAVQLTSAKADREVVYEVTCHTGDVAGAGTSSNCYITLRGEGGEFGPCALDRSDAHSAKPGLGVLAQNATDVFDIVALNVEPVLPCPTTTYPYYPSLLLPIPSHFGLLTNRLAHSAPLDHHLARHVGPGALLAPAHHQPAPPPHGHLRGQELPLRVEQLGRRTPGHARLLARVRHHLPGDDQPRAAHRRGLLVLALGPASGSWGR